MDTRKRPSAPRKSLCEQNPWQDEILREVYAVRDAYAAEHGYDLDRIYADLKRREALSRLPRAEARPLPTADEIAEMASRGQDVSAYFTNKFTVVRPVRRVNVDLSQGMLRELDERAARLNITRQAVIKTLLGRALNDERTSKPVPRKNAG